MISEGGVIYCIISQFDYHQVYCYVLNHPLESLPLSILHYYPDYDYSPRHLREELLLLQLWSSDDERGLVGEKEGISLSLYIYVRHRLLIFGGEEVLLSLLQLQLLSERTTWK